MRKIFFKCIILFSCVFLIDFLFLPILIAYSLVSIDYDHYCFDKADILVLGDSHTQRSINSNYKGYPGKVINLSKTGNYTPINYLLYKSYRDDFPPPKIVIISTQMWMFESKTYLGNLFFLRNRDYSLEYLKELFSPREYFTRLKDLKINSVEFSDILKSFIFRIFIRSFTSKKNECIDVKSFIMDRNETVKNQTITSRLAPFKNQDFFDYRTEKFTRSSNINHLNNLYHEKLVSLLAQENVKVILLETPEYFGTTHSTLGKVQFYKDVLNNNLSGDLHLIKHDDFEMDTQNPAYFYDGGYGVLNSHMNINGVEIFQKQLAEKINKILKSDR